jgi:cell division protein FtsI (penicillin-binding protein 3)
MTPGIPQGARVRAYLAALVVTIGLVGVAYRAWALQVDDNGHYLELAARQHALTVDIPAPRGEVIDANGKPLAVSADADSVWANPHAIHDVTATAEKLATLVGAEPAAIESKLAGDRRFVWIDRHVTPEVARAVREAKLPGIEVAREPRRWYPGRTIGGPVIGRADIDGNGLDGIELAMNEHLTGTRGEGHAVRDARGRKIAADGLAQPAPGATVRLTIDRSIQAIADTAIANSVTANKAKSGVVVVLDVATGHVLAMSSFPTYDPNTGDGHTTGRNRPVTDVYEAGSVMKMFSIATALDDGAVKPDTEFDLHGGLLQIGSKTIRDVDMDKYLTVSGIIKRSSNVGAAKIAQRLGKEKLYAGLARFGFGAKTRIELPGEQAGTMRPAARWRDIDFATISYGYGLTVTPVQIAAALAAIGNRGVYQSPRVVDQVVDADGNVSYRGQGESHQVVSARTADQMRLMLASVFEGGNKAGTGAGIVVPGFKCGGKTGTANKYDPETHKYALDRYLSSFAGLAPIENPRLAIVVLVDEPSGADHFGGKVAGPVFAVVASESLRYLGVPGESLVCPPRPTGVDPLAIVAAKTCTVATPRPAKPVSGAAPAPVAPIVAAAITPDASVAAAATLDIGPAGESVATVTIPDFRGMGMQRAIDTARTAHLAVDIAGSGRVIDQDPAPGPTRASTRITLRFSDGDSRNSQLAAAPP